MCCWVRHQTRHTQTAGIRHPCHVLPPPPGLLVPVDEEHPSHLILGVLLTLRYMMPLLQQQVNTTSLKGSFGVMRKEADVQPTPEQMLQVCMCQIVCVGAATCCSPPVCLQVYELTLHYTQHWDHNVVTAALELLQQMFRTPPPELLHLLITAGSISHATVFRQDNESRARSGSILELIGNPGFCLAELPQSCCWPVRQSLLI